MFSKGDDVLLFTDFSRACAQEWIHTHGRRFTCYRKRKDEGSKAPRHKHMQTDRAVQLRARVAHANLREQAEEDTRVSTAGWEASERPTVLGVDRRRLMASVARLPAPDTGKNHAFPSRHCEEGRREDRAILDGTCLRSPHKVPGGCTRSGGGGKK